MQQIARFDEQNATAFWGLAQGAGPRALTTSFASILLVAAATKQGRGGELGKADPCLLFVPKQDKGLRDLLCGGLHVPLLLGPRQKFAGHGRNSGRIGVKYADDGLFSDVFVISNV